MPVIIVTGIPCSGKTSRTLELKNFFESKKNKKVQIISEEAIIEKANFEKNDCFSGIRLKHLIHFCRKFRYYLICFVKFH